MRIVLTLVSLKNETTPFSSTRTRRTWVVYPRAEILTSCTPGVTSSSEIEPKPDTATWPVPAAPWQCTQPRDW